MNSYRKNLKNANDIKLQRWLTKVIGRQCRIKTMLMVDNYVTFHSPKPVNIYKITAVCAYISMIAFGGHRDGLDSWARLCGYTNEALFQTMRKYVAFNWSLPFDIKKGVEFTRQLGTGNSTVFESIFTADIRKKQYAIKRFDLDFKFGIPIEYILELHGLTIIHNHPNAPSFLGSWVGQNHVYIVYELYQKTLYDLIHEREKLDIQTARKFTKQLLNVVACAHSRNLAHRDIKPRNILISDHTLVLGDWDSSSTDNEEGFITDHVCTLPYRAPEYLIADTNHNPFKLDAWSIGCVLLYMLIGKHYFESVEEEVLLLEIAEKLGTNVDYMHYIEPRVKKPWPKHLSQMLGICGIDFLDLILHLDPLQRISVHQALMHPFITQL
jgi:serine/threonine protein kinase